VDKPVKPKRAYNAGLRREQARTTRLRILEAARRLFVIRGYSTVTMDEIAKEAGVAYQTVYSVFGNKLRVAQGIIWSSFEIEGIDEQIAKARESPEPEVWFRSLAHVSRLISERLGDLLRFMRESGDPELLTEYQKVEDRRFEQERSELLAMLERSGRLREGLSASDAVAVIWAMTGTELQHQLVSRRRWSPSRYEKWLGDALIAMLLGSTEGTQPPRAGKRPD
jgi:AcrR family transcriptional regulator